MTLVATLSPPVLPYNGRAVLPVLKPVPGPPQGYNSDGYTFQMVNVVGLDRNNAYVSVGVSGETIVLKQPGWYTIQGTVVWTGTAPAPGGNGPSGLPPLPPTASQLCAMTVFATTTAPSGNSGWTNYQYFYSSTPVTAGDLVSVTIPRNGNLIPNFVTQSVGGTVYVPAGSVGVLQFIGRFSQALTDVSPVVSLYSATVAIESQAQAQPPTTLAEYPSVPNVTPGTVAVVVIVAAIAVVGLVVAAMAFDKISRGRNQLIGPG